ncbi:MULTISPECIES: ectoine/hydroxyectoine ABC transporter ATP-binding protein EhuA [Bacillus]|uniref:Polar amino acid transport system ATP-binding protein n=1 Tax=Bacillus capparidis TaxID=1840411 RepID=A0ABS4D2K2_9BACI|nr:MULTISPECIES: ectoine/hydroxyectoine ABC transporter ATP-binding protein EhuA [Bacillus]MBP1083830.1 polar amino acid transport system ATP-binding protein [Bacillus capparidis]MED1098313.1 ectoine/hydroxyectoine ABC transporter ATP-binding protein EhuA [Bacillus capparidis]
MAHVRRSKNDKPIVQYRNIKKSFGEVQILNGVDLDLYPGEKVAVIGPSGSGKTTLARMLMTLEEPSGGTIEVEGESLWHKEVNGSIAPADKKHFRKVRGKIGMVFQQYNLFPHMTILRNVMEAPVHVLKIPKEEAKNRAIEMLTKVGLANKLDAYPAQLSGGQQQRVAIARACVMKPKIMLFDEVTAALDPELVGEVLQVIKNIADDGSVSMMIITHEMDFAYEVADRVVFMADGQIVEQAPPKQLFSNPTHQRTKDFLSRFLNKNSFTANIL